MKKQPDSPRVRRLRTKIILVIMAIFMSVLAVLLVALNVAVTRKERSNTLHFLHRLARSGGHRIGTETPQFPNKWQHGRSAATIPQNDFPIDLDMPEQRTYFAVELSASNEILSVISDFPLVYAKDEIEAIVSTIVAQKNYAGYYDDMLYLFTYRFPPNKILCVVNTANERAMERLLAMYSLKVFAVATVTVFLLSLWLASVIIRPVADAFRKQKQFISDAGHELKTPVAVVSANIDVVLEDYPDNKWLQYIKIENERMGKLVQNLLYLARSDADQTETQAAEFDFDKSVERAVLPFETTIYEQGKTLDLTVQHPLRFVGDEENLKQAVIILVDNAIKNSEPGTTIRVRAYEEGQKLFVKVHNRGHGIATDELEKIFERFYRSDESRERKTGGYGLGLPIARTIAEFYHGTLVAESKQGEWAEFTLTLPLPRKLSTS